VLLDTAKGKATPNDAMDAGKVLDVEVSEADESPMAVPSDVYADQIASAE
jgi:hypothetical protein